MVPVSEFKTPTVDAKLYKINDGFDSKYTATSETTLKFDTGDAVVYQTTSVPVSDKDPYLVLLDQLLVHADRIRKTAERTCLGLTGRVVREIEKRRDETA